MAHGMSGSKKNNTSKKQVINFTEIRSQRLQEKRKHTERIFFKNLLSVYSITDKGRPFPIELIDLSEEGCSFQIQHNVENPWPQDTREIPVRLYFSKETFLEILVKIKNSSPSIEKGIRSIRYGCVVDTKTQSYVAYQAFVRFLKLYAEQAHKDTGKVTAFYI